MKWVRRIYRSFSILTTAIFLSIAAWIFWPTSQPTEKEMLRLVPTNAVAVFVQRDLAAHWPAFKASAFLKAWQNSPLMPVRIQSDSRATALFEQAMLDLFGKRIVGFIVPDSNGSGEGGLCALVPVTPRVKWLWVRAMISQHLSIAGFTIKSGAVEGHKVSELISGLSMGKRIRFTHIGNVAALAGDWSGDSMADLVRSSKSRHTIREENDKLASEPADVLHCGWWEQPRRLAQWSIKKSKAGTLQCDLVLPKQRIVRLPWDATRGPRSMALIQKLFPDQGLFTVRGRASHWMMAWDNVAAWCGLPAESYSEQLISRIKYGEHLSHGLFPWSGAGDEFSCVIAPATSDTLPRWPLVVCALRCWEPNDTQIAMDQLFASLANATSQKYRIEKVVPDRSLYLVRVETQVNQYPLFYYRYASGLVMAGNSPSAMQRFDPNQFDGQKLEPAQPENQLFCKADEIGSALQALGMTDLLVDASLGEILKSLSEVHLTVRVEKETVDYSLEIQVH